MQLGIEGRLILWGLDVMPLLATEHKTRPLMAGSCCVTVDHGTGGWWSDAVGKWEVGMTPHIVPFHVLMALVTQVSLLVFSTLLFVTESLSRGSRQNDKS